MDYLPQHRFHIPVMGLAFTIDSPAKVARFGIASVISIVEDRLIEMMRRHYYPATNREYQPITTKEDDYRAKRITDYLNLINAIVQAQMEKIRNTAFETGSEIIKYFEMLPEDSMLKHLYRQMMNATDRLEKEKIETYLRTQIKPGSIDVNIMTKLDRNNFNKRGELQEDGSDAVASLRGYAKSNLSNSSVIFSAGMNPRLYNYLEKCKEFDINEDGNFTKKIIIKVSDYRSALIQGKYLAKKGIWVSEFRIESGLNCGGHAFATEGYLLGPILEEFKSKKEELISVLFELYKAALGKKTCRRFGWPPQMIFSVQGGIGTHAEANLLHQYYGIDSTGWGTPFLLVPEATTVDDTTLKLLCDAGKEDVVLSRNSPLDVRFHYLKNSGAEYEKQQRISLGRPGSPCTEKHLVSNTEFTQEPICTASHQYQKLKTAQLLSLSLPEEEYKKQLNKVLDKECLCVGLSNAAAINYNQVFIKTVNGVTICPGPNIINFNKVVSLQTMTDHIYGRQDILSHPGRPHMFITELHLYIDYLKESVEEDTGTEQYHKRKKYYSDFCQNLMNGISYYRGISGILTANKEQFNLSLTEAEITLHGIAHQYSIA